MMQQRETMPKKIVVEQDPIPDRGDQFRFEQGVDSPGNNLAKFNRKDVPHLKKACEELTACRGFNTAGIVKYNIVPEEKKYRWSQDPTQGLYIKNIF